MYAVFVFYYRTLFHIRYSESQLPVFIVQLFLHHIGGFQLRLHHLSVHHVKSRSLQVFHAFFHAGADDTLRHRTCSVVESRHAGVSHTVSHGEQRHLRCLDASPVFLIFIIRYNNVGVSCSLGLQYFHTYFLQIIHQIAVSLYRIVHVRQTAQYHGVGLWFRLIHRHLHFFLGGFAKLHVYLVLSSCCLPQASK